MLIRDRVLEGIRSGEIDRVYRRWAAPRIKVGSQLRTTVGVLEVVSIEEIADRLVTDEDARAAGIEDRQGLLDSMPVGKGPIYRVALRYVGLDPRISLRERVPDDDELARIRHRLDSLDRASRHGEWTGPTLALIAEHPATRAADLAAIMGLEKQPFKNDVRKLKELGLTESLEIGYRLSPRGRTVLDNLNSGP